MSSANDELIKLILSVEGKSALDELRATEAGVRTEIEAVRVAYEAGEITQEAFLESGKKLTKQAADLGKVLNDVAAAEAATAAAQEAAAEETRMAWGDAMRARIDGFVRAELAAEHLAAVTRQTDGDALRARIDAHARADAAAQKSAAVQKAAAAAAAKGSYDLADAYELVAHKSDDVVSHSGPMIQAMRGQAAAASAADSALHGQATAATAAATSTAEAGHRSAAAARGVLELSRGVEDFTTGGPLGLLNNIPGIFQAIGGAIGLTGTAVAALTAGVSLLATGAYIVWRNWDAIKTAMGSGHLKTATDEMEELGKKTRLTADEQARLNELKEKEGQRDAAGKIKSTEDRERESAYDAAVARSGGSAKITEGIRGYAQSVGVDQFEREEAATQANRAKGAQAFMDKEEKGSLGYGYWKDIRDKADAAVMKANADSREKLDAYVKRIEGNARGSDEGLDTLIGITRTAPGGFRAGTDAALRGATPYGIAEAKKAKDREAEVKAINDRMEEERKAEVKEEKGQVSRFFKGLSTNVKTREDNEEDARKLKNDKDKAAERTAQETFKASQEANKHRAEQRKREADESAKFHLQEQAEDRKDPTRRPIRQMQGGVADYIQQQTGMDRPTALAAAQQALHASIDKNIDLNIALAEVVNGIVSKTQYLNQKVGMLGRQVGIAQADNRRTMPDTPSWLP